MFKNSKLHRAIGAVLVGACLFAPVTVKAAETLSPPLTPSKTEIIQKWKELDQNRYVTPTPFEDEPSINVPYKAGVLKQQYIDQGVKTANFYRYMSGLPMNFTSVKGLNDLSQYGSVLTAKNGYLDHHPSQPADMPTDFYNKGYQSTSSSNLAALYWNTNINMLSHTVDQYMDDSDPSNIANVGHRSWVLSPYVSSIGFGLAKDERQIAYSALNVFGYGVGTTSFSPYKYFAFPGNGDYPKEYFKADYAWSIGIDTKKIILGDLENVKVTLTRNSDGKVWSFSYSDSYNNSYSGNYFSLSNVYGNLEAIIFKPAQLDYIQDGEEFTVNVSGIKDLYQKDYSINYKTTFFDLLPDRAYGKLIDEETNQPLSDANVSFYQVTSTGKTFYKTITTNSSGEFDYTGFPIGEYELKFEKEGYYTSSLGGFQIEDEGDRFDDYYGEISLYPNLDKFAPAAPIVNLINDHSNRITGYSEADSTITVKVGTTILGTTITGYNGNFSLAIPVQKAGTKLMVTATDDAGNTSEPTEVTVGDGTPPNAPVVNEVTDGSTSVTGTAEVSSTVTVKVGTTLLGTGVAGDDGTYTISIPSQKAGTILTVTAIDYAGNESEPTSIKVVGSSLSGWVYQNGEWYYYLNGTLKTGWLQYKSSWYYLNSQTGIMETGWLKSGGTWYFLNSNGSMKTGWFLDGSTWYYLSSTGAMKTGWLLAGGSWYYLSGNGSMKTGWVKVGTKWYYFYSSGKMAYNTKIGSYWLGADGGWIN